MIGSFHGVVITYPKCNTLGAEESSDGNMVIKSSGRVHDNQGLYAARLRALYIAFQTPLPVVLVKRFGCLVSREHLLSTHLVCIKPRNSSSGDSQLPPVQTQRERERVNE